MDVVAPLLAVAGIHLLSCMSPGPNFLVSLRSGLREGRRALFWTTFGVACGSLTWTLLGVLGVTAVLLGSPVLFTGLKLLGGAWLVRLGVLALRSALFPVRAEVHAESEVREVRPGRAGAAFAAEQGGTGWRCWRGGLLTCLSNPKAAVYFLALFSTVLGPDTPSQVRWLLPVALPLISFTWYTASVLVLTRLRGLYARIARGADAVFGVVMLAVGVRILLSRI